MQFDLCSEFDDGDDRFSLSKSEDDQPILPRHPPKSPNAASSSLAHQPPMPAPQDFPALPRSLLNPSSSALVSRPPLDPPLPQAPETSSSHPVLNEADSLPQRLSPSVVGVAMSAPDSSPQQSAPLVFGVSRAAVPVPHAPGGNEPHLDVVMNTVLPVPDAPGETELEDGELTDDNARALDALGATEGEPDEVLNNEDLFNASKNNILSRNPIMPVAEPVPDDQFMEDLMYYRYGFAWTHPSYQQPANVKQIFKYWDWACRAVGGQHLDHSSQSNQQPTMDFLNILASSSSRFFERVPAKCWDLDPSNPDCLWGQESHNFCLEVKNFGDEVLCLLHPIGLKPNECPAWIIAVPPATALECIRRGFGPDPYQLAEYLVANGMEFRTLQRLASRPPQTEPDPRSFVPKHPAAYKFDTADYAKYQTVRDSFLESHGNARRALSFGGVIARLAREILPVAVILAGPSQAALDGKQDVLVCGDEVFVDDGLSPAIVNLICGTYELAGQNGLHSWFPHPNVWGSSGLQVGHWTVECETWYTRHLQAIVSSTFVPMYKSKWRNSLRLTQLSVKVLFNLNQAALEFLESPSSLVLRQ